MTLPYSEGTVFLVPIPNKGYARGVVARSTKRGKVLLGYFFGPCFPSAVAVPMEDINPAQAILRVRFGDLGLIKGSWLIVGKIPDWNRSEWPMPDFARRELLGGRVWLVRYSDTDPNRTEEQEIIASDTKLDSDSMFGYGAVETKLSKLLNESR